MRVSTPGAIGLMLFVVAIVMSAPASAGGEAEVVTLQRLVDVTRQRLALTPVVRALIVPNNRLLVSVAPVDEGASFELSVDRDFLEELSDEELEASIAHELGHVWIFTHHPYLQTEALANQVAMRVVTKSSLIQVYDKVWRRLGSKGDLARFVGD